MSETQVNTSPTQNVSIPIDNRNNTVPIASRQINEVIEFQEPTTSKNYSIKTEIRINIMGEQSQSNNSDDSITLSMSNDDNDMRKEPMKEDSFTALGEGKTISALGDPVVLLSRNERYTRPRVSQGERDPPPPYQSQAPPSYYDQYSYTGSPYQQEYMPRRGRGHSDNPPYDSDLSYELQVAISFEDIAVRHDFVQKVFAILCVQLLITTSMTMLAMLHKPTGKFIRQYYFIVFIMMGFFFATYIALMCFKSLRRKFPVNYILLTVLTVSMSYLTAFMTSWYETKIVLSAVATLMLICFVVSLLAYQTWFDITKWTFIISIASIIIMVFGLIAMILSIFGYKILWIIYCGLAVILFSVFLLYDMQCILGGRRVELSPEEYIYGALTLYIDIIYIFWYLLQLYAFCR